MDRVSARLVESARALGVNVRSRNLRYAQAAFGAAWASEWAVTVALGVVAFRAGGAAEVGLVALLRMLPSALVAPLGTAVADRMDRGGVLAASGAVRAVALAMIALLLEQGGPVEAVYGLAVLQTIAFTVFRPVHSALLPALCHEPRELTSATVARGLLDALGIVAGPLLAALLLDLSGVAAVFASAAALSAASAAAVLGLHYQAMPRTATGRPRVLHDAAEGFRMIARHGDVAVLVGLVCAQAFTRGCFTVLVVVVAFEVLDTGDAGVGLLTTAVGAGALAGALGTTLLVGVQRLAAAFGIGVALWGLPLALSAALSSEPAVMALLAVIGIGNTLVDVGIFTLPARLVPDEALARVFGVLESLGALTVGLGAILTPVVIDLLGVRGAMVGLGLICPALVALAWPRLRRLDRTVAGMDREIAVLRDVDMLRPLPLHAMEHLAQHLDRATVPAGADVFRQGDVGDSFYVVVRGEADVVQDGRHLRTMGRGQGFGEIALLRGVVRTATVSARTPLELFVLERRYFTPTVTGFHSASTQAERVMEAWMRGNP
jgi:MFS family permease